MDWLPITRAGRMSLWKLSRPNRLEPAPTLIRRNPRGSSPASRLRGRREHRARNRRGAAARSDGRRDRRLDVLGRTDDVHLLQNTRSRLENAIAVFTRTARRRRGMSSAGGPSLRNACDHSPFETCTDVQSLRLSLIHREVRWLTQQTPPLRTSSPSLQTASTAPLATSISILGGRSNER